MPKNKCRSVYMLSKKAEKKCWEDLVTCKGHVNLGDNPEYSLNLANFHRKIFDSDSDSYSHEDVA